MSAGESYYVQQAFGRSGLSTAVGWLVITMGVVSAATLANAIVLFLQDSFALHRELGIACVVLALGALVASLALLGFQLFA